MDLGQGFGLPYGTTANRLLEPEGKLDDGLNPFAILWAVLAISNLRCFFAGKFADESSKGKINWAIWAI